MRRKNNIPSGAGARRYHTRHAESLAMPSTPSITSNPVASSGTSPTPRAYVPAILVHARVIEIGSADRARGFIHPVDAGPDEGKRQDLNAPNEGALVGMIPDRAADPIPAPAC